MCEENFFKILGEKNISVGKNTSFQAIYSKIDRMKIILTIAQIKKILANEPIKLPVTFQVGRIKKTEIEELIELLKKKKKD